MRKMIIHAAALASVVCSLPVVALDDGDEIPEFQYDITDYDVDTPQFQDILPGIETDDAESNLPEDSGFDTE